MTVFLVQFIKFVLSSYNIQYDSALRQPHPYLQATPILIY